MDSKWSSLPLDVMDAAKQTYELEKSLAGDLSVDALGRAIEAGIRQYEARVTERIAEAAETYADEFAEGDETTLEGATLHWFAEKLRGDLSPAQRHVKYVPQDDDVVEVTVTGVVTTFVDECEGCGYQRGTAGWMVRDDNTGEEYGYQHEDIDNGLQIRVLHKADDPLS